MTSVYRYIMIQPVNMPGCMRGSHKAQSLDEDLGAINECGIRENQFFLMEKPHNRLSNLIYVYIKVYTGNFYVNLKQVIAIIEQGSSIEKITL